MGYHVKYVVLGIFANNKQDSKLLEKTLEIFILKHFYELWAYILPPQRELSSNMNINKTTKQYILDKQNII